MADLETPIQKAIIVYLRAQFPRWIVHHSRNEINKRGAAFAIEIAKAKAKGAVTGFPDLIVIPQAPWPVMFLEVKAPGNYASAPQKAVHADLESLGQRVAVVRSIADVQAALWGWGVGVKSGAKQA